MDDGDSGHHGSIPYSVNFSIPARASALMSSSPGDERSAAGSRSSIVSIPLSEVASSPVPASLTTQMSRGITTSPQQHQEPLKAWREPPATDSSIRHLPSAQHHPMLVPTCLAGGIHHAPPFINLPLSNLLPPPTLTADQWSKHTLPSPRDYLDEKHYRRLLSSHHGIPQELASGMPHHTKTM